MRNPLQLVLDFLSPLHERTPQALDKLELPIRATRLNLAH
jgi:hypothetical protein